MAFLERYLRKRPTLLNVLHAAHLARPDTQTIRVELECLERHAAGARLAVEIGSYQGVSAAYIARALAPGGKLHCIDTWPRISAEVDDPCFEVFRRHLQRQGVWDRIDVMRSTSAEAAPALPGGIDFIFVDGDHSLEGIRIDWEIVLSKVRKGGIVCLHDTITPEGEPWRVPESIGFYEEHIRKDPRFERVERCHSMNVLVRRDAPAP